MLKENIFIGALLILAFISGIGIPAGAQGGLPDYLKDRGEGIATSMFGTYIRKGEVIVYPFFEYYHDNDAEYKPSDFVSGPDEDFRGKFRAHEGLIYFGYGISDRLALEIEAAVIKATQYKADNDPSNMPARFSESGLGDVESQLRWRWSQETGNRPELFSYFETVFPLQKNKKLIGTQDWEFKLGAGIIKGFGWGTITVRAAMDYIQEESKAELGEFAVEYLKRISNRLRIYAGAEGSQDEVGLITEAQFFLTPRTILKLYSGFGVTSKATDFAPELGVMFFP
jgi:hypothetical protein